MQLKRYELEGRRTAVFAVLCVIITLGLVRAPVRAFIADYRYNSVQRILDDKQTPALDTVSVNQKSLPAFMAALERLRGAGRMEPSRALYHKALGDIYYKLGSWAQVMGFLDAGLPPGALQDKEAFGSASVEFRRAIALEPLNPDAHLSMGMLLDTMGDVPELAQKEYMRATAAFPVNAPMRYAVIRQLLVSGRTGDAMEQARVLAQIDDTYRLTYDADVKSTIERMDRSYQAHLSRSYLFHAFKIVWQISKDPLAVKGITPDNDEARAALELFLEWNDIDG